MVLFSRFSCGYFGELELRYRLLWFWVFSLQVGPSYESFGGFGVETKVVKVWVLGGVA